MSREEHAREGAQVAVPDDQILDVAVVEPRGSTMGAIIGATAGVGLGGTQGNTTAWGVVGGMIGQRVASSNQGSYPSIVLALSPSRVYVLGRTRTGLVGGWKNLHPVAHIDRANLTVTRRHHGTVPILELTDKTTGTTLEFEAMHLGGLGLNDLLAALDPD